MCVEFVCLLREKYCVCVCFYVFFIQGVGPSAGTAGGV